MTFDAGRVRHDGALMHYSRGSNGSSIPSNWKLSATGDTGVTWTPESAGGSVSYGSNSNSVGTANAGGASTNVSRADHVHLGVRGLSSNGSNALLGDVDLQAGTGIALGVAAQSITITNTGSAGGGSVSYGSNSNEVSYANAAGASSLASRADHVHKGVTTVSHTSNTFAGPVIFTTSGVLGITVPTPGTLNFSSSAAASGGGGSSGALVLLEQHTASSSATLDFTTGISSTYDTYLVEFLNIVPASNAALIMRMGTGAGPTWDAGNNYAYTNHRENSAGQAPEVASAQAQFYISSADTANTKILATATNFGLSGRIDLTTAGYPRIVGQTFFTGEFSGGVRNSEQIFGAYESTTALTGIRFLMSTGNIASGTIRLYGLAK